MPAQNPCVLVFNYLETFLTGDAALLDAAKKGNLTRVSFRLKVCKLISVLSSIVQNNK